MQSASKTILKKRPGPKGLKTRGQKKPMPMCSSSVVQRSWEKVTLEKIKIQARGKVLLKSA